MNGDHIFLLLCSCTHACARKHWPPLHGLGREGMWELKPPSSSSHGHHKVEKYELWGIVPVLVVGAECQGDPNGGKAGIGATVRARERVWGRGPREDL